MCVREDIHILPLFFFSFKKCRCLKGDYAVLGLSYHLHFCFILFLRLTLGSVPQLKRKNKIKRRDVIVFFLSFFLCAFWNGKYMKLAFFFCFLRAAGSLSVINSTKQKQVV